MRMVKSGVLAAAAACLMGISTAAWAVDVQGSVVCAGTSTGIPDVGATFTQGGFTYTAWTDANGVFNFHIYGDGGSLGTWGATLDLTAAGGPADASMGDVYIGWGTPFILAPFEVDVEGCAPPPPPPPPSCPELDGITEGAFCPASPLGNPKAECAYFGLVPSYKEDNLSGPTHTATTDADLAIVKAGSCYNVYAGVTEGDTLAAPFTQGISHVTYCDCPPEE